MDSLNPAITQLHVAFCEASGYQLPLLATYERWYFNALQLGITPEDLAMCLRERKRLNAQGNGFHRGVFLRNLLRDEEDIAIVIEEVAALKAKQRIKLMEPAKARVLAQAHRPTDLPQKDPEQAKAILKRSMEDLRKAIEL